MTRSSPEMALFYVPGSALQWDLQDGPTAGELLRGPHVQMLEIGFGSLLSWGQCHFFLL